jgi:hypothetical protein
VGVETAFGLQANSKHDRAADLQCSGAACPTNAGIVASDDAIKAGNISTPGVRRRRSRLGRRAGAASLVAR